MGPPVSGSAKCATHFSLRPGLSTSGEGDIHFRHFSFLKDLRSVRIEIAFYSQATPLAQYNAEQKREGGRGGGAA